MTRPTGSCSATHALAWEERRPFRDVLESDAEVTLDSAQLNAAFDLTRTLRHVDRFAEALADL